MGASSNGQREVRRVDSFEEAYAQHEALVRGFLRRLCGDDALAEELTQETF